MALRIEKAWNIENEREICSNDFFISGIKARGGNFLSVIFRQRNGVACMQAAREELRRKAASYLKGWPACGEYWNEEMKLARSELEALALSRAASACIACKLFDRLWAGAVGHRICNMSSKSVGAELFSMSRNNDYFPWRYAGRLSS